MPFLGGGEPFSKSKGVPLGGVLFTGGFCWYFSVVRAVYIWVGSEAVFGWVGLRGVGGS